MHLIRQRHGCFTNCTSRDPLLPPLFSATCFRSASGFLNSSSKFYFVSWFFWLVYCSPTSFLDKDGIQTYKPWHYHLFFLNLFISLSLSLPRIRQRIYLELLINHYPIFFFKGKHQSVWGVWFMFSNNHFQFLNNISRILIQFFTYTYFTNIFKQ